MADTSLNIVLKAVGQRTVIDAISATQIALGALKSAISASVGAALESEKAQMRLAASLEISGRGGSAAVSSMLEYSDELAKVTLFSDEAITRSQALFAQLTNLDKNGLQKATKAAIGLSTTYGIDLQSATEVVTKAVNGNIGALSRYTGKVNESLTPQEQLRVALEKLEKGFNLATKEAETTGGQWAQLKKQTGELFEAMASSVLSGGPGGKVLTFFTNLVTKMKEAAEEQRRLQPLMLQGLTEQEAQAVINAQGEEQRKAQQVAFSAVAIQKVNEEKEARKLASIEVQKTEDLAFQARISQIQTFGNALGQLTILMSSENKKAAAIGKAAAIAKATTDTYVAANASYSAMAGIPVVGPVLGAIAAAAAIAAGLINVAKIAQVRELGFADGGLVNPTPGGVPARIGEGGSREAVIPLDSRRATREIAESLGGSQIIQVHLMLEGRELANTMIDLKRQGLLQGRI